MSHVYFPDIRPSFNHQPPDTESATFLPPFHFDHVTGVICQCLYPDSVALTISTDPLELTSRHVERIMAFPEDWTTVTGDHENITVIVNSVFTAIKGKFFPDISAADLSRISIRTMEQKFTMNDPEANVKLADLLQRCSSRQVTTWHIALEMPVADAAPAPAPAV